jgi:hypothetical protein
MQAWMGFEAGTVAIKEFSLGKAKVQGGASSDARVEQQPS